MKILETVSKVSYCDFINFPPCQSKGNSCDQSQKEISFKLIFLNKFTNSARKNPLSIDYI